MRVFGIYIGAHKSFCGYEFQIWRFGGSFVTGSKGRFKWWSLRGRIRLFWCKDNQDGDLIWWHPFPLPPHPPGWFISASDTVFVED